MKHTRNGNCTLFSITVLSCLMMLSQSANAVIYQWKNFTGVTQYSSSPPGPQHIFRWTIVNTPVAPKPLPFVTPAPKPQPAPSVAVSPPVIAPPVVAVAPSPSPTVSSSTAGWTFCANEYQTCTFSGTKQVRYGDGTSFFVKTATGGIACSNAVFGDPKENTVKRCEIAAANTTPPASTPLPPALTSNWTFCANENQNCTFSGTKQVRYGSGTSFFTKTATGSIACANAVFGDPIEGTSKRCEIAANTTAATPGPAPGSTPAPTPAANPNPPPSNMNNGSMGMPIINMAMLPPREAGKNFLDLRSPATHKISTGVGASFRIVCRYSHMANDDPVVYPGQPGRSHLHTFFGNTGVTASSTNASLVSSGDSTCDGGTMNRSAYWIPSLIDTKSGKPVKPIYMIVYYKTGRPSEVKAPPKGLRMIAGNPSMTNTVKTQGTEFFCFNVGGEQPYIPNCPASGDSLVAHVEFPECWDGKNLDSANHRSHMAYAGAGNCPSSHPVRIPVITINAHYAVAASDDLSKWRLASDMYSAASKGGYSLHADWMNGWIDDPATGKNFAEIFTEKCLKANVDCGSSLIGDGRQFAF